MVKKNKNLKKKYGGLAGGLLGFAALCGTYAGINAWSMHTFDKYVIKNIEIAANVSSVSSSHEYSGLSMESALIDAKRNLGVSRLENPAIIWETPLTEISTLNELLAKTIERARQIGQFKEAFSSGEIPEDAPEWVREANARLNVNSFLSEISQEERGTLNRFIPTLSELAESEYGQRIGSEYEALNTVVAGGTRLDAKSLEERHRSLLDTLDKAAGWRSIIRFQADDYKQTFAHVFVGYLMANMGYVTEGLEHFRQAKTLMDWYDDDKNLSIIRDTPELSQRIIKELIDSSINELEELDNDPSKYSTGWWKRLKYYNQSIGGQTNPSIQDMAEEIYGRYSARGYYSGILGLISLSFGGMFAKRLRNVKKYEVKPADRI